MKKKLCLVVILLFLSACSQGNNPSNTDVVVGTATLPSTNTPKQSPIIRESPSPINTITQLPPTSTILPLPTLTSIPLYTLSPEDSRITFQKWLDGYLNCLLPCWAGIVPGETTFEDAMEILKPVTNIWRIIEDYECSGGLCDGFDWEFVNLPESNMITGPIYGSIDTNGGEEVYYLNLTILTNELQIPMDVILQKYGVPQKVIIQTANNPVDEVFNLDLLLSYPNHNFVIRYSRSATIDGNKIVSCGEPNAIFLDIEFSEEDSWTVDRILRISYGEQENYLTHRELEDATDFTIESFYNYYLNYPDACLSTPTSSWPEP